CLLVLLVLLPFAAFEELSLQCEVKNTVVHNLQSSWSKEAVIIKEPQFCIALQNLLLYFPACISADESGKRLFLSDSKHHRIIIFDGNGKILDSIGSSPGFEDGEFESAKLLCPAASFYHDTEDCLYIVDSENHAIRRADLESRVLETIYPTSSNKRSTSLWTWIRTKLGFSGDADLKLDEHDSQALMCPWHLINLGDNNILITSRSFENLWVMDLASGAIKESVKELPNTLEFCRHFISEKVSLLKTMPDYLLQQHSDANLSREELPYAGLISCVTTFENHVIMCDTVGQGVLKLNRESGISSNFQFSNLGVLGLPYWLSFPLERIYSAAGFSVGQTDHIQEFSLLPGRVDIRVSIDIPEDTELVEPLHESCIWCQARGAATELSVVERVTGSSEKVGVAQQWYDELDNLAFAAPESELVIEDDNATTDSNSQDERIHIDCEVNTSPGTSEVIIYAALYLKLRRNHVVEDDNNREKFAARIANILDPKGSGDCCTKFLLKSNSDLRDLIFIKPLHVQIKLNSHNHPKAENSKDIILTDSSVKVDVSLN
ncbi:uncharacterized protein LOC120158174, partial [Hibiscus syriacus]|uniref:uncharacterized protein LOC120158174 n=1 Tax=Hibiscus syriacus TaxID=106335 RepID=UPI001922A33A